MTFEQAMALAFGLYKQGDAVVLKDKSGRVIHGEEELRTLGMEKCRIIPDVDSNEWKASEHWQGILKGARQGWLRNREH
jgi:hypothetical protein